MDSSNDHGIFATNPAGILQLIAREGNPFDINPDPLVTENRMVRGVNLITGSGTEPSVVFTDFLRGHNSRLTTSRLALSNIVVNNNGDVAVFGYLTEQGFCRRGGPCEPREFGVWTQQLGGPLSLAVKSDTTLTDADKTMAVNVVIGISTNQLAQTNEGLQILVGGVSETVTDVTNRDYSVWSVSADGTQRLLAQRGAQPPVCRMGSPSG